MADAPESNDDFLSERRGKIPTRPKLGTALVESSTGDVRAVQYVELEGMAVVEGDIALGSLAEVAARTDRAREEGVAHAVAITGVQFRWTNCTVPFEIDPALPNQQRVTDAIQHWRDKTGLAFVERTTEANWIYFTDDGGCWSFVGMRGGRQTISVGSGCSTGNTIHEIGHAVGLWHEQSREDRDTFVTIQWANIQSGMETQFSQHIVDGDDVGGYDYGSIMHYPRKAFSKNGNDTIVPTDSSATIGQRNGLSELDIAAVAALYPACHRVIKQVWKEPNTFKKIRDAQQFKKIFDDERRLKPIRDLRKGPRDPGPVKYDLPDRFKLPNVVVGGTRMPFPLVTPHHADLARADKGAESTMSDATTMADQTAALQSQLLETEAALAGLEATVAESTAEIARLTELRDTLEAAYAAAVEGLSDQA